MTDIPSVLLVDDEPDILEFLSQYLQDKGLTISTAQSGQEALQMLGSRDFDLVISDIRMPGVTGVELLREIKKSAPGTVVILITAYATAETAIDAQQHGAYGYLTKPFKNKDEIWELVSQALQVRRLKTEAPADSGATDAQQSRLLFQALHRNQIIGRSPKMVEVYKTLNTVACTDTTVLLTGESGTGKELVARAIHEVSNRRNEPFVTVNCGAFPETLLESELFGYLKGAFTGANSNKKGLFESAARGSIFLDEIGEMTAAMQVKLLRVLQERKFRPLGGTSEVPVDIRVIAATNRDLKESIQHGEFREDLYYRIAVITIRLPPLRERDDDIDLLAMHFLRQYAERAGKSIYAISPEARHYLESYPWPGNIRELENTIERAVALESTEIIQADRIPETIRSPHHPEFEAVESAPSGPFDLESHLKRVERTLICSALERTQGNQTLAAEYLGITKPSLRHKLQTHRIDAMGFRKR